ncbi:MAG: TOBE domain-containing protein [Microbacterium sp.]|uniref:TOBE domain-containing protein n=1 Tax=Microbacterium sp. TaxID=51671 RepID=UPI001AD4569B|nr:TOBE domain-containing protein [Microbacterium sp.]MBN9177538.1 TOBE domain-containing protein [Microbacterium sp.]
MTHFRISEASSLIGVSDDTVRRWGADGTLDISHDGAGRQVVDGAQLARLAQSLAADVADVGGVRRSARNRFTGLVTKVEIDGLMAQVELQCGPHRVVTLMSSEAAREMQLEIGSKAVAVVKATMVILETEKDTPV